MSLGIAVVGCGRWGQNHVRTLHGLPQAQLRWVVDPSPEARARALALAPGARATDSLDEALRDDGVQAVVVATPAQTHGALALAALRSGRHVLVEKPLTPSLEESTALVAAAAAAGRLLAVGHLCVYMPAVQRARHLIAAGALGALLVLDAERTSVPPARPDVDVLWDLATHDLSILQHWAGAEPLAVAASGAAVPPHTLLSVATATLWYPGPVLGRIRVSWHGALKLRRASATGASAVAVFDDTQPAQPLTLWREGQPAAAEPAPGPPPLQAELQAFLDAAGGGGALATDGRSGLAVIRTLTALQRSLERGGARVELRELDAAVGFRG